MTIDDTVTGVDLCEVTVIVNGQLRRARTEVRTLLSDFLRHDLGLTGTHVGCEHGACGACTVLVDGTAVRACLMLAVQVDGGEVTTVEGITPDEGLSPLQDAMWAEHGLQCGFCTPGILCSVEGAARAGENVGERLDDLLGGHICRCTGYQNVRAAVRLYCAGGQEAGR
ncbi:(2Fe-2S)-binding protein [Geodermatophilus sp. DF01-2]|uniref:(2Fe-2S)-binding protein n=1 Tax=Geodermatophilus sp. DF01-2 TaxID=2559610 RepID=UPI001072FB5A|nr:(2Fe-2S)-binding protein [Geodermatophilus sp. DF01_2]TFV59818.1 (2Fe-2S)-binding protein [Geodermatophilus sp. DF01_2]